jgi:pimeloyl-ACP methyl ester carboxylesterase
MLLEAYMTALPTLLLVHGAWHGSWCWDTITPTLRAPGSAVISVDLPSCGPTLGGLADDAAAVRAAIDAVSGPVTVVAHSYGGIPVTQAAAGASNVAHLVYVAAFMLDEGASLLGTVGGNPPPWWTYSGDRRSILAETPEAIFYNDCTPDVAAASAARLTPQSAASTEDALSAVGWREHPSSYVICEKDNALPPFVQEAMSGQASTVHRLDAGHSPFLSRPDELAALLVAAAT